MPDDQCSSSEPVTGGVTWTQSICEPCWAAKSPDREPYRLITAKTEKCAYCGRSTPAGIYVRDNPAHVPFPRSEASDAR